MNEKDTFTYKQILIGLRNEFLTAQKRLDELSNHIFIINKGHSANYYFNLHKAPYEEQNPELILEKDMQSKNILLNRLKYIFNPPRETHTLMLKDNNGNYYPKNNDFNVFVNRQSKEEFEKLVEKLLNSDFAKYMTLNNIIPAVNSNSIPRIVPRSFQFYLLTENSQISYLGRHDILEFASVAKSTEKWKPLTQEHLDYVLGIKFPKVAFSEYHKRIIEENIADDRKIILYEQYKPEIYIQLKIEDDNKKLILTKNK